MFRAPSIRLASIAISLLAGCILSPDAFGQAGKWQSQFETPIGPVNYVFDFKVDGQTLTGTAAAQVGDQPRRESVAIRDGKINGQTISFVEMFTFQGNEMRIAYTGTIKGDEIQLKREVGDFGSEDIVVKRMADARPAAMPPVAAQAPGTPAPAGRGFGRGGA